MHSLKDIVKKLYLKFISRKTTIFLIAILAFFYFLGLVIPQKMIVPPEQFLRWQAEWPNLVRWLEALELTKVYSSPVVILFTALFFLNLLIVTARRVPAVMKEMRLPETVKVTPDFVGAFQMKGEIAFRERCEIESIKGRLKAKGYRIVHGEAGFKGVKNNFSSLGSLFFHFSFIFFLVGGLLIFHTRFRGETFITEGQSFEGKRKDYKSVARLSELRKTLPEIKFNVEKIEPRFEKMEPVSLKTLITAESKGVLKKGSVEVNHPFTFDTTFILITDVGVAPFILVTDKNEQDLFGAYVSLNVVRGDEDYFTVPGTDYRGTVRFWPDYAVDEKGAQYTRSYYLSNPVFKIDMLKGGASAGSGMIKSSFESVEFDGNRLRVGDIRYYGKFIITDEKGGGVLIAGFVLSIIGLMLKFVWTKKEVYGVLEKEGEGMKLLIGYKTEYLKGLGRAELEKLLSQLR